MTTLEVLRQNELYAKLKKSKFWLEKVGLLGHMASKDGVSVDPQKIEVVIKWPTPKNAIEVQSFLRLMGYYLRFVQDFSKWFGVNHEIHCLYS